MVKINLSISDKNISKSHSLIIIIKKNFKFIYIQVGIKSLVFIPDTILGCTGNYYSKYKPKNIYNL